MRRVWFGLLCVLFSVSAVPALAADYSSAVVFAYQRVGEDSLPHASVSAEQFAAHMEELTRGNYVVKPLREVIAAIKAGDPLPHKTVALTFDGAYASTLKNALPLLDARNYPYTVFISSDAVDRGDAGSMTWDELRALQRRRNAELAVLPAHYHHMAEGDLTRSMASVNRALGRFEEELGRKPAFFAWPYGEYSLALKRKVAEYGFDAAFGNHAGAVYPGSDFMALPRFVMNELQGGIDRFKQTATALPLPVSDISPDDPILKSNPPMIGFTVSARLRGLDSLSCFVSGEGKIEMRRVENRVELRPLRPFTNRRTRVNCTMPDDADIPGEEQHWRWFSMIFIDPDYEEPEPIADTTGFE